MTLRALLLFAYGFWACFLTLTFSWCMGDMPDVQIIDHTELSRPMHRCLRELSSAPIGAHCEFRDFGVVEVRT